MDIAPGPGTPQLKLLGVGRSGGLPLSPAARGCCGATMDTAVCPGARPSSLAMPMGTRIEGCQITTGVATSANLNRTRCEMQLDEINTAARPAASEPSTSKSQRTRTAKPCCSNRDLTL